MIDKTPYTPGMREVLKLSKAEAGRLGHDYIGPEHYLLGVIRKGDGLAVQTLMNLDVDLEDVKMELERMVEMGKAMPMGLFSPNADAKRVLETSKLIATEMKHGWVGTEHLLLALIKEENTLASKCLRQFGVDYEKAKKEVVTVIEGSNTGATKTKESFEKSKTPALDMFGRDLTQLAREGKLGPGDRARAGDGADFAGALPPDEKTIRSCWAEPGGGQDGDRRRAGAEDRQRRHSGIAAREAAAFAGSGGDRGRDEIPRAVRGTAQGDHAGNPAQSRGADLHRRNAHADRRGGGRGGRSTPATCSSRRFRGARSSASAPRRLRNIANISRRMARWSGAFSRSPSSRPTINETKAILKGLRARYEQHHNVIITDEAIDQAVFLSDRYVTRAASAGQGDRRDRRGRGAGRGCRPT